MLLVSTMSMSEGRIPTFTVSAPFSSGTTSAGTLNRDVFSQNLESRQPARFGPYLGVDHVYFRISKELSNFDRGRREIDFFGSADLLNATLIDHGDPIAKTHRFQVIMRHVNCRRPELGSHFFQFSSHGMPELGVEVTQRLVHQKYVGLPNQCAAQALSADAARC